MNSVCGWDGSPSTTMLGVWLPLSATAQAAALGRLRARCSRRCAVAAGHDDDAGHPGATTTAEVESCVTALRRCSGASLCQRLYFRLCRCVCGSISPLGSTFDAPSPSTAQLERPAG